VPSNLYDQWLEEIAKFVNKGKSMKGRWQSGMSPKDCPWKIFAMSNVAPLTNVTAESIADVDVVLCSYRLLYSQVYQARRKAVLGRSDNRGLSQIVHQTSELLSHRTLIANGRKGETSVNDWRQLKFPLLEMFYWRRIVFDEFHELESFDSLQQNSLQHFRAHYRWGLTGTPPVDSNAGVIFMSSLFRIDLPGYLPTGKASETAGHDRVDISAWEGDRLLTENADNFLRNYCRQNTADLPHIGLEEHVLPILHTPAERALYLGQAHDAPDMEGADTFENPQSLQALEKLLKLCSHFQAQGDNSGNAKEEVLRIGEQKDKRVVKALNQLSRCARALFLLESKLPTTAPGTAGATTVQSSWRQTLAKTAEELAAEGDNAATAAEALKKETSAVEQQGLQQIFDLLEGHRAREEQLLGYLGLPEPRFGHTREQWCKLYDMPIATPALKKLIDAQAKEQQGNARELRDAKASQEFFRRTVNALQEEGNTEARTCSVCLEDNLPLSKLAITKCAHTFCIGCLTETVKTFQSCSICRQALTAADITPVSRELEAPPPPIASSGSASSSSAGPLKVVETAADDPYKRYGSKLATLAHKLRELRAEDPTAKVIVFVQFDDLKRKVAAALHEFGISAAMLQGQVGQRANVIREWQQNASSSTFVLMLSLAQSASGTNLTAASHVVFLHPMLAPTAELAVAHELQAIGRARRHGQPRDVVHVWRLVTRDTIEQTLTERHQATLWERESAAALARAQAVPAVPQVPFI